MAATRALDLEQLQAELADAGITVPALGRDGDDVFTYDQNGQPVDLPAGAAAVIEAHTPSTAMNDKLGQLMQSTVGVAVDDLTQAQRLALLTGLLSKAGAINPRTLAIRPLNTWLT